MHLYGLPLSCLVGTILLVARTKYRNIQSSYFFHSFLKFHQLFKSCFHFSGRNSDHTVEASWRSFWKFSRLFEARWIRILLCFGGRRIHRFVEWRSSCESSFHLNQSKIIIFFNIIVKVAERDVPLMHYSYQFLKTQIQAVTNVIHFTPCQSWYFQPDCYRYTIPEGWRLR